MKKLVLTVLLSSVFLGASLGQETDNFEWYGNIRFAYLGSDTQGDGFGGENTSVRFRVGGIYTINDKSTFRARLATTISQDFESLRFTVRADGGGLDYGSVSFDEFYYQYEDDWGFLRVGRFQGSIPVYSNARRSHLRFHSNVNFIHWSDGLYLKRYVNEEWFTQAIVEYQPKGYTTFPYRNNFNFGDNDHNITSYLGLENTTRDDLNFIQKGFGILYSPGTYLKPSGYSDYLAFSARAAVDVPSEPLNGGSWRFAGEIGQNLNTDPENGTSLVVSAGVNKVADKHEFMVEFAKTGSQWLTAPVYGPDSDEVEFRYRYFISPKLNFDARYRIRDPRPDGIPTVYSTFLRLTYSL